MSEHVTHLALDAGQSSTRIRVVSDAGTRDVAAAGVDTSRPLAPQWESAIRGALAETHAPGVHTVSIGSSGLESTHEAHALIGLLGDLGTHRVVVAHDSITSYLGALGPRSGCVVAAGTGTICLAVGPHRTARVDGWGWIMGDAGSAYWIGRTGLEAALRGHDGRRQMTALTQAMADTFGDVEHAYVHLQSAGDRVARVAAFAREVDRLAASDRVAGTILDKAAAHLAEAVQAAVRRAHLEQPPRVAAVGGVFHSERVLRSFVHYLTLAWPTFALAEPLGHGIDGAALLTDLSPEHPLHRHLSVAER